MDGREPWLNAAGERKQVPVDGWWDFGVGGGIRTLDSRSHSPEFYH